MELDRLKSDIPDQGRSRSRGNSYHRRFISGFARVAHPLHALTKKDTAFCWTSECETAFNCLKDCLVTAPELSYPCFGTDKELILETDANGIGLGTVLAEEHEGQVHPIAYASRSLDPHERNYGISELETLAFGCGQSVTFVHILRVTIQLCILTMLLDPRSPSLRACCLSWKI